MFRLKGQPGETGARAGVSGFQTCGSVWACPVCSEIILTQRQTQIADTQTAWLARGGSMTFATFTMSHQRGEDLAGLWDDLLGAWRAVQQGSGWVGKAGVKARHAIAAQIRAVEVTHGRNGWHPHLHVLFFHQPGQTPDVEQFRVDLFNRWYGALVWRGRTARSTVAGQGIGVDVRHVEHTPDLADTLAGYLTKHTYTKHAAYELTGAASKRAGKGRTPFQILAQVVDDQHLARHDTGYVDKLTGELIGPAVRRRGSASLRLWREWEQASKGRRQIEATRGFIRSMLGQDEVNEEEAAANLDGDVILTIPAESPIMNSIVKSLPTRIVRVLAALEMDGRDGLCRELAAALSQSSGLPASFFLRELLQFDRDIPVELVHGGGCLGSPDFRSYAPTTASVGDRELFPAGSLVASGCKVI